MDIESDIKNYEKIKYKTFEDIKNLTIKLKGELFFNHQDMHTYIKYLDSNNEQQKYSIHKKDQCEICFEAYDEKEIKQCEYCRIFLCENCYRTKNHMINCVKKNKKCGK